MSQDIKSHLFLTRIPFTTIMIEQAELTTSLILDHPFIYELILNTFNPGRMYLYLVHYCDFIVKLSDEIKYFANSIIKTEDSNFFLKLARGIKRIEAEINRPALNHYKMIAEIKGQNYNYQDKWLKSIFNHYLNQFIKLRNNQHFLEVHTFIFSLFHTYCTIEKYMKKNMQNLDKHLLCVDACVVYCTDKDTSNQLDTLTEMCNSLSINATTLQQKEMYRTFKVNVLYTWLALNECYYMPLKV